LTIGGTAGFKGTVDEFGVYYRDSAGRSAPDPDLYMRAQALKYGHSLLFANGFDGIYLSNGLSMEGNGTLGAGSLSLPAGAGLALPPLIPGGSSISVVMDLSSDSVRTATLEANWDDGSQPSVLIPLTADAVGIKFSLGADGLSIVAPSGTAGKSVALPRPARDDAGLVLKIKNPADAKATVVLNQLLVVQEKQ
jgi:hypothetical protein